MFEARNESAASHKKPQPLNTAGPTGRECPVCGHRSYSTAGIHPQCAHKRSEATRLRRTRTPELPPTIPTGAVKKAGTWYKSCPKCGKQVHVRRKACECGRAFDVSAPAS